LKDDAGNLDVRVARDRAKQDIDAKEFSHSVVERVIEGDQPVREARTDGTAVSKSIGELAIHAVMCVPLTITDPQHQARRTFGAIYVDSRRKGEEFDESALAFFDTIARQVAVSIENARLYKRVGELNKQLAIKLETTERELEDVKVELADLDAALATPDLGAEPRASVARRLETWGAVVKAYERAVELGKKGEDAGAALDE